MTKIVYYEIIKRIESSTPIDTPDSYYSCGCFERDKDAEKEKERLLKELLILIRKDPSFYNLHTDYFIKEKELRLK